MIRNYECKACSGELKIIKLGIARCLYCGKKQPVPMLDSESFVRANRLRQDNKDFDGAMKLYEDIVKEAPQEAEAYWGIVLCRYGIEYVADIDGELLPTCHRTVEQGILNDADYRLAIQYSTEEAADLYKIQAETIDVYQKKIKHVISMEEPYDVFVCFKANDYNGVPTLEYRYAQKIYNYLSKELNLKVFFSPVSLKNRIGEEYEPIIYAALSSSKVLILTASCEENIESVWVKNEWQRFHGMITKAGVKGIQKKIIPALINMNSDKLPTELAGLQTVNLKEALSVENMGNNIEMFIGSSRVIKPDTPAKEIAKNQALNLVNLGRKKMRKSDFFEAKDYFERALEKDLACSEAYWGRMLAEYKVEEEEILPKRMLETLTNNDDYAEALRYASKEQREYYESVDKACHNAYMSGEAQIKYVDAYEKEYSRIVESYRINEPSALFDDKSRSLMNQYKNCCKKEEVTRIKINNAREGTVISKKKLFIFLMVMLVWMLPCTYVAKYYKTVMSYSHEYGLEKEKLFDDHEAIKDSASENTLIVSDETKDIIEENVATADWKILRTILYVFIVALIAAIALAAYMDKSIVNYIIGTIGAFIGLLLAIKLIKYTTMKSIWILIIIMMAGALTEVKFIFSFFRNIYMKISSNKIDDTLEVCVTEKDRIIHMMAEDSVRIVRSLNDKYKNDNPTYGVNIEYYEDDKLSAEIMKMCR